MHDLEVIESINCDQLVTPLDRIMLRNGSVRRTRRSYDLAGHAAFAVARSQKRHAAQPDEKTVYMRAHRASRATVGIVAATACLTWLYVAVVCLLA
jgi:hypothetical protein